MSFYPFVLPWLHLYVCLLSLPLTKSTQRWIPFFPSMASAQHSGTRTGVTWQKLQKRRKECVSRCPEADSQAGLWWPLRVQPEVPTAGPGLWSYGASTLALGGHQPLPPCRRQEAWAAAGRTGCAPPLGRPGRHLALAGAADAAHLAPTPG